MLAEFLAVVNARGRASRATGLSSGNRSPPCTPPSSIAIRQRSTTLFGALRAAGLQEPSKRLAI